MTSNGVLALALAFSPSSGKMAAGLQSLQLLAFWLVGVLVRGRRQAVSMAARSAALQRQAEQAAAAERARIARELHDSVAHHLSGRVLDTAGARASGGADPRPLEEGGGAWRGGGGGARPASRAGARRRVRRLCPAADRRAAMISVLIADDQHLIRKGLRMLLEAEPDLRVAGEAGDGGQALAQARRLDPDVILMDVRMPGLDGIQATTQLAQAGSRAKILMLTTFNLDEYVYHAMKAGASGLLLKDATREQLPGAIRAVCARETLLPPAITRC